MLQVVPGSVRLLAGMPSPGRRLSRRSRREERRRRRGAIGNADPTVLQQNGSSSELRFCCKRGHPAILPSHQILPAASRCQSRNLTSPSLFRLHP